MTAVKGKTASKHFTRECSQTLPGVKSLLKMWMDLFELWAPDTINVLILFNVLGEQSFSEMEDFSIAILKAKFNRIKWG